MDQTAAATALIERFARMVERDGGTLRLLTAEGGTVRIGYRPGSAEPDCADGACVLPGAELQKLMSETAARRSPGLRIEVEVLS
jgi:hypothetical protein